MTTSIQWPKKVIICVILLSLLAVISVSSRRIVNAESEKKTTFPGKLLVLPFHNMAELYGKDRSVRCPVCGKVFITGEVPKKAAAFLSDKLVSMLRKKKYYKKMVVSDSQWAHVDLLSQKNRSLSEREVLVAAGRSAGADTVMVGYLYRFQQRVGSKISVDTPASVAFGIHLIGVKTGRELWKGHVDETQRSLSENLFTINKFIKRKASWVTSEEMAVAGLEEILQTLPKK